MFRRHSWPLFLIPVALGFAVLVSFSALPATQVEAAIAASQAAAVPLAPAPAWETWANNPGNTQYVQLGYDVVFVATKILESSSGNCPPLGQYDIGTDVVAATKPSAGNSLWIVTRNGDVKKLFPLPSHENVVIRNPYNGEPENLIETPVGFLDNGSVVEPNVSEDGTRILFSYFHDTLDTIASNQGGMSKKGADIYVMDMSAILADPTITPSLSNMPVTRVTFAGSETTTERDAEAMNLTTANIGNNGWGNVYLHAIEFRNRDGLNYLFASSVKRNVNSNRVFGVSNYNLNLYVAPINPNGSMGPKRQMFYYTTTSAMSPTPLPNGAAFSYQASTADGRNWHIQSVDSEGRWNTLIGYGSNPDLFHLGAYCVDDGSAGSVAGDYFIATRYYNLNNNGFGALFKLNLADQGLNTYDDSVQWGVKPRQFNSIKITRGVPHADETSEIQSTGTYTGKMTSPSCGLPMDLFFAYTPTSANGKDCSTDGKNIYHAYIGYRENLEVFDPTVAWSSPGGDGLRILVDDSNDYYTLVWARPLLSWMQRTGNAKQGVAAPIIDPASKVQAGLPFAQVGTSAIYNTDRKPYDCWLSPGNKPYDPITQITRHNINDKIVLNFDAVTKVFPDEDQYDQGCAPVGEEDVLAIQINVTSNKLNHNCCGLGYETDGSGVVPMNSSGMQETARILGIYDVSAQADTSFIATIPANTPFEFHLLDIEYGLRLVDVRSWHDLDPRETRTNCNGCHQHEAGAYMPKFAGTVADGLAQPLDMTAQTQIVTYDSSCTPVVVTTANASEAMPEWVEDVWVGDAGAPGITSGFDTYCGSCHRSPNGSALSKFSYTDEASAYENLKDGIWASTIAGAIGSPAWWAARGKRTDGRDPLDYTASPYSYDPIHGTALNLCGQSDATKANWVHTFGQWIDNHMPRNTGLTFGGKTLDAKWDRYHPTVDGAVVDSSCMGLGVRIGYWDESGSLANVEAYINGTPMAGFVFGPTANGSQVIRLGLLGVSIADSDVIEVHAEDNAGNRVWYEKTGKKLKSECRPSLLKADPVQPGGPIPVSHR